jgi:hypothetical protein
LNGNLTTDAERQKADYDGLKQKFDDAMHTLDSKATDLAKALQRADAPPDAAQFAPRSELEKQKTEAAAAMNEVAAKDAATISDLNRQINGLKATPSPAPAADPNQIVLEPLPKEFQKLDGMPQLVFPIGAFQLPVTGSTTIRVGKVKGTAGKQQCQLIPLPLPKSTTNDAVYDPKSVTVSRPKGGLLGSVTLCSFSAENGEVLMQWPPPTVPEDDTKRKEFLKYCMLSISDDKSIGQIQFLRPELIPFDPTAQAGVALPLDAIGKEAAIVFPPGSPWISETGPAASVTSPKEKVRIYIEEKELRCTYNATLNEKLKEVGEKQDAWNASIADLRKKETETDGKKLDEAALKQAKVVFKEKSEEFAQAQENINDLKNPKSFPNTDALLLAKNGVVLCRIKIAFTR